MLELVDPLHVARVVEDHEARAGGALVDSSDEVRHRGSFPVGWSTVPWTSPLVGAPVGTAVGTVVGAPVGTAVGAPVGTPVGTAVRAVVGAPVRAPVAAGVGGHLRVHVRALLGHVPVLVDDVVVGVLALVLRAELVAGRHVGVDVAAHRLHVAVGAPIGTAVGTRRRPVGAVAVGTAIGTAVGAPVRLPVPRGDVPVLVLPLRVGVPRAGAARAGRRRSSRHPGGRWWSWPSLPARARDVPDRSDEGVREQAGEDAADDRTDHRDPRVAPVAGALVAHRQDGVRDARAEVTGRVDGVAGRAAERGADADDEQGDRERAEAARRAAEHQDRRRPARRCR